MKLTLILYENAKISVAIAKKTINDCSAAYCTIPVLAHFELRKALKIFTNASYYITRRRHMAH